MTLMYIFCKNMIRGKPQNNLSVPIYRFDFFLLFRQFDFTPIQETFKCSKQGQPQISLGSVTRIFSNGPSVAFYPDFILILSG